MPTTKPFYDSTTLRGAFILAFGPVLTALFKAFNVPINESEVTEVLVALMGLAGVAMVVYGRFRAGTKLTK